MLFIMCTVCDVQKSSNMYSYVYDIPDMIYTADTYYRYRNTYPRLFKNFRTKQVALVGIVIVQCG